MLCTWAVLGLTHLCEYTEDCEHTDLAVRVLNLIGVEGSRSSRPHSYIRCVYNRVMLEKPQIRAGEFCSRLRFLQSYCSDVRCAVFSLVPGFCVVSVELQVLVPVLVFVFCLW